MGFRLSGCPQCGFGPYENQVILTQRIVYANDMHCVILETRRCRACDHRYSVEVHYSQEGERVIQNEHKKTESSGYVPCFGIDWSQE